MPRYNRECWDSSQLILQMGRAEKSLHQELVREAKQLGTRISQAHADALLERAKAKRKLDQGPMLDTPHWRHETL